MYTPAPSGGPNARDPRRHWYGRASFIGAWAIQKANERVDNFYPRAGKYKNFSIMSRAHKYLRKRIQTKGLPVIEALHLEICVFAREDTSLSSPSPAYRTFTLYCY
jgi:hypothetical protein